MKNSGNKTKRNQFKLFEKFQLQSEEFKKSHDNHEDILMVLSFGQKVRKAYDDWCEEVIEILEKKIEGGGEK